jgi:hypothetical protein
MATQWHGPFLDIVTSDLINIIICTRSLRLCCAVTMQSVHAVEEDVSKCDRSGTHEYDSEDFWTYRKDCPPAF